VDGFAMDDLDGSARLVIAEYGGDDFDAQIWVLPQFPCRLGRPK
jgi:hypothetical protein